MRQDRARRREKADSVIARGGEFVPVALCDGIAWRQRQPLEIQKFAAALNAEIKMRASGQAGHADKADALALLDALARAHQNAREMHVVGFVAVGVLNFDYVPCPAFRSRENNFAVADGLHRRAGGRAVIDSEMRPVFFQNWVKAAVAEMRSNRRGEFQWRVQEGFLHGFAVGRVIGGVARGIVKKHRAIYAATIDVFGGENFSVGSELAAGELLFLHHHPESVARPRVGIEIEVPAENFRQAHGQLRLLAG